MGPHGSPLLPPSATRDAALLAGRPPSVQAVLASLPGFDTHSVGLG